MGHQGLSFQEAALFVLAQAQWAKNQKAEPRMQQGVAFYTISTSLSPAHGNIQTRYLIGRSTSQGREECHIQTHSLDGRRQSY